MDRQQECKICNNHVVKLAQHVRQAHDMNMVEYYDTETEIETEDAPSSDDESGSDEDESASDENMSTREESDSDEAKQTFFEFLLKNIENCEE